MKVVLYSTNCPKCNVLKKKLEDKHVEFEVFTDVDKMIEMGMQSAPNLGVDGEIMDYSKAIKWVNERK